MTVETWRYEAHDTWFFRESRPHGVVGGLELGSVFPPPARTLAGATRFLMGESVGVNWNDFRVAKDQAGPSGGSLQGWIGFGDDLGSLHFAGPWLTRRNDSGTTERLFPAPAFLMSRGEGKQGIVRLALGSAEKCDLGRVRLPQLPTGDHAKPLDRAWLTLQGLRQTLAGELPASDDVVLLAPLVPEEPRLGIARENALRTVKEGLLYQTRHLRPNHQLAVEIDVELRADKVNPRLHQPRSPVRFGGEGRMAMVSVRDQTAKLPHAPRPEPGQRWLALCLLTHADFGRCRWRPEGLNPAPGFDPEIWNTRCDAEPRRGESIALQVPLTLHSAILGKPIREGGWDLANHRSHPVRSLVPAGSVWLCTVDEGAIDEAIAILHGTSIGYDTQLGRGLLAVGLWAD